MSSAAKERIAAHKKRVEEIRRVRQAFQLQKSEEANGGEVFAESGGRARSRSTLSSLSHLYTEARPRSGSGLSRLSKPEPENDTASTRSGSDAAVARQAARQAALKSEIDSLKKQVAGLQKAKEESEKAHKNAATKLEDAEAEGDEQLALIAKLQEQLASSSGSSRGAKHKAEKDDEADQQSSNQSSDSSQDSEVAALKNFQSYVQNLRQKHTQEVEALQAELGQTKEQLHAVTEEYENKQTQWAGVAETLMSSSKGASIMQGEADLSIVLEEHQLYKEENDELRGMLEEALQEVDSLGSRVKAQREAQEFLEHSLGELEDENQRLQEQMSTTHASQRSVSTRDTHIRELRQEMEELQTRDEGRQAEVEQLQQEVDTARTALADAQQQLADTLNGRHVVDAEMDDLRAKLAEREEELVRVRQDLAAASEEAATARAECEKAVTQSSKVEAQAAEKALQAQRAADSEMQAALTSAESREKEVRQLELQLEESRDNSEQLQFEMESILTTVRKELAESQGSAETAAVAGLSLSELVDQLKEDKIKAGRECEEAKTQLEEAQAKLQEREGLLTQVMEHLQSMGGGTGDGAEGGEDALHSLTHQLQRAKEQHQHTQEMLTQLEEEADALQAKVQDLEAERKHLRTANGELETSLAGAREDLQSVSTRLEEREAMLSKVMEYLKGAKGDEEDEDLGDGSGEDKGDGASLAAQGLDALAEQLAEAERERERLRRAKTEGEQALAKAQEELSKTAQALGDEEDARVAQAEELEQSQKREKMLQEQVGSLEAEQASLREQLGTAEERARALEAELKDKTDELAAVRAELEGVGADMRAAAEAGLSLTEMLNKLKQEHAARVAELEEEIRTLKARVAEYERILEGVKEMLEREGEGEEGNGDEADLMARLKKRLEMSDAERDELQRTLEEMEEEMGAKDREIEALKVELEQLRLRKSQLEERLADLQQQYDELEAQYRKLEELLGAAAAAEDTEQESTQQAEAQDMSMGERLQKLLDELRTQAEEIARLKVAEKQLGERVAVLEQEKAEAQGTIADLEDQVTALQQERDEVEAQLSAARVRIDELEEEIARLKAELAQLRAELDKTKTLAETQQLVLDQHREMIETLKRHNDTVESTHTRTEEKHTRHRDEVEDTARVTALQAELRQRDAMIEALKDQLRRERELLRRRYLSRWRKNTPSCEGCGLLFSLRNRRHHCRLCGKVMCHACCSDRVRTSSNRRPVRVCRDCFDLIVDIEQEEQHVLEDARVAFDQARRGSDSSALVSITISKQNANDPVGADFHYYDLDFELKVTVARVLDKTPASVAGIKPGMLVMAINGREVAEMLQEEFEDVLRTEKEIVLETVTATAMERARAASQRQRGATTTSSTSTTPAGTPAHDGRPEQKGQGKGLESEQVETNEGKAQRAEEDAAPATDAGNVENIAGAGAGAGGGNSLKAESQTVSAKAVSGSPLGQHQHQQQLDIHAQGNGARSLTLKPPSGRSSRGADGKGSGRESGRSSSRGVHGAGRASSPLAVTHAPTAASTSSKQKQLADRAKQASNAAGAEGSASSSSSPPLLATHVASKSEPAPANGQAGWNPFFDHAEESKPLPAGKQGKAGEKRRANKPQAPRPAVLPVASMAQGRGAVKTSVDEKKRPKPRKVSSSFWDDVDDDF